MLRKTAIISFLVYSLLDACAAHAGGGYPGLVPGDGTPDAPRASHPSFISPYDGALSANSTYQQREAARQARAQENLQAYQEMAAARHAQEQEIAQKQKAAAEKTTSYGDASAQDSMPVPPLRATQAVNPAPSQNSAPGWPYTDE